MRAHGRNGQKVAVSLLGGESLSVALLDATPIGILLLSDDLHICYRNPASAELLPVATGGFQNPKILDFVAPDDRNLLQRYLTNLKLRDDLEPGIEARFPDKHGRDVWVQIDAREIQTPCAPPAATIVLTLCNVDDRKRTDLARQVLEERWNSALVSSTLGVWDHDFKNGTMYYSDTWKMIRGLSPDDDVDAETDDWIQTVHPDDRAHVLEWIRKQNEGEVSSVLFEYRERRRDGAWIWIECRGSCIEWDAAGKPQRIVGTDLDITERKATEEMLAHTQRRLELALDVTKIGVFEADVINETLLLDDRLLAIYDMEGAPNLQEAHDWEAALHPDDRLKTRARIDENVDSKSGFSNQFRIVRKNGDIRHISARAAPFIDQSGNVKYIGANWDVTEDVQMREELERAKALAEARNRELEATRIEIEHTALHDYLTDLPNRRYLDGELAGRGDGSQAGLAILHVDLDRFKQINDTLGHQAGDFMLLHAAKILRTSVGPDGFVARIGGDEFVILCDYDETNDGRLVELADSIIRRMSEPVQFNGKTCRIGASIGIAVDPQSKIDAKQLLLNADIALYRAKSRGRNRHEFFSIDIHHQVINTKRVSDEILEALERREFVPYYQPQFTAESLTISGAESLARWKHPTKGILGPDAFLTIAGDLDAVGAIDAMILEQVVADLDIWTGMGIHIPKISVNVSTQRLYDPVLAEKLLHLPIRPGTISFELLESIFLDDCDDVVQANLRMIRQKGIGIEIDDFGTGHASIVSLLKIAPDTLKIDRELIRPVADSPEQSRLVRSIIEIGKSLNIKVVAEGVETADHIRILRELDCDILQGYALARPMPFSDIAYFISGQRWRRD